MKLFESGEIGKLTVHNRIVMAPMFLRGLGSVSAPYEYTRRTIDFYAERAKGGVGLIITGTMLPSENLEKSIGYPLFGNLSSSLWLSELAETVHDYGTKIFVQCGPGFGRQNLPLFGELVGPSPVPGYFAPDMICREITLGKIKSFLEEFTFGVSMIGASGIDGIELHAHQGYLLDEFMTARTNSRADEYGGNLEGRLKLILEMINAVKMACGPDFPISVRYGLTHKLENEMDGGRTIEEGLEIARRLEKAGVSALHIDAGVYETNNWAQPPTTQADGCLVELAALVRKTVGIPVIAVGKLGNPVLAETVLKEGKADFIALGRPLLADPQWPNKVLKKRAVEIRPCLSCNEGCLARTFKGKTISCAVNPCCGNEQTLTVEKSSEKKLALVVGGGPAGMETARVLALRGHNVVLFEKGTELGGNLITAGAPAFKRAYLQLKDYLIRQLHMLKVDIRLGTEATPVRILSMNPDVVFIATGARPIIPDIPGMGKTRVLTAVELFLNKPEVGDYVIIVGGSMTGTETALHLARQGRHVTLVERLPMINLDMFWINALDIKRRFDGLEGEHLDIRVLTNTEAVEVVDEGLVVRGTEGRKDLIKADTVVLAVGMEPSADGLAEAIKGKVAELYRIGDCAGVGKVMDAIWPAYRKARLV